MTDAPGHPFAIATLEEVWDHGLLVEERLAHGSSIDEGSVTHATSSRDDALVAACAEEAGRLRSALDPEARTRLVVSARRVAGVVRLEAVTVLTIDEVTVVNASAADLRAILRTPVHIDRTDLPIVWQNGSAAVLLHEAVGHAAEAEATPVQWPRWLRVMDEPSIAVDDCGIRAAASNLLREPPRSLRRESFRNAPLRRMQNLVARADDAPFERPHSAIDVFLVAAGTFDPLSDVVTIDVAVSTAGPFSLRMKRDDVARSLAGAFGPPLRYPGVICSMEGQRLFVGSHAPVMVTR